MNGLECASKIRELERTGSITGHVPIIAVTANARREQLTTALEHGMVSDYLAGPEMSHLLIVIGLHCDQAIPHT